MAEDLENRTEEPKTHGAWRRRGKRPIARSVEVTSAAVLLTGVFAMSQWAPDTSHDLREAMRRVVLDRPTASDLTPAAVGNVLWDAGGVIVAAALPVVLAYRFAGTVSNLVQVGVGFYPAPHAEGVAHDSPANGIQRIFSRKGACRPRQERREDRSGFVGLNGRSCCRRRPAAIGSRHRRRS